MKRFLVALALTLHAALALAVGSTATAIPSFKQSGTGAVSRTIAQKLQEAHVSVADYGAKADAATDATTAFQNAINAVSARGGGVVEVPVGAYYFAPSGALTIPRGVTLRGMARGPFDGTANPSTTIVGPTLMVTNTTSTFLTLDGVGSKVMDVLFWYPTQVAPTAAAPSVFPYTITATAGRGSQAIERVTVVNAYDGIDIQSGRVAVRDVLIGAFHNDIRIDNAMDWVELVNVKCQVMWNVFAGLGFPQTIDAWVMSNGTCLDTRRVDSLQAVNLSVFGRFKGHNADDSANVGLSPRSGYGRLTNVDFDYVAYGAILKSANVSANGFKYVNVEVSANGSGAGTAGQSPFMTVAGGLAAPVATFVGGAIRGTWAAGSQPVIVNAGKIKTAQIAGLNPFGALTAPAVPASTVAQVNQYPFPVRVHIAGGTVTNITINGTGAGTAPGLYWLEPGDSIAITYSAAPSWAWFGV